MYKKFQVDISYFNQDTKQNTVTCQNSEKPQSIYLFISSISTSLTEEVLNNIGPDPASNVTAGRGLTYCKIHIAFYVVSSHFCLIAFTTVQVW